MSWDGIRGTLQWVVVLLLLGALVTGATAARWWAAKDALLTQTLTERLDELFPTCDAELDALRIVDGSHVEVTNLLLRSKGGTDELLRVPRLVVAIDALLLRQHRRIVVREVVVHSPEILITRDVQRTWNWSGFQLAETADGASPIWIIRNGTVRLGLETASGQPPRTVSCQGIQLTLSPESHRRYQIHGQGMAESVGALKLAGILDGHSGEWNLSGDAQQIRLGDELVELASAFHPPLQTHLSEIRNAGRQLLPHGNDRPPIQTAELNSTTAPRLSSAGAAALLRADLSLKFELGQSAPEAPLAYALSGRIEHGQISEDLLGRPLNDLSGGFELRPDRVRIDSLSAANGPSRLFVNGQADLAAAGWNREFVVQATQLPLGEDVRALLPDALGKYFDLLRPSGTFEIDVALKQSAGESPAWTVRKFVADGCRVVCDYFRYPAENIHGEITQIGSTFRLMMQGTAGGHPVRAQGTIDPRNPEQSLDLHVEAGELPVDGAFVSALQREDQQQIRRALESLHLGGIATAVHLHVSRGAATNNAVAWSVRVDFRDGVVNPNQFPYPLKNVSGRIRFEPQKRKAWLFENLTGVHGGTQVTGGGEYDLTQRPARLDLRVAVLKTPLDHDLKHACVTAHPALAGVWSAFDPAGQADVDEVRLRWNIGSPPEVDLTGIRIINGRFTPAALPYAWSNVNGVLHWEGKERRLRIHSLDGVHNDTYMRIDGSRPDLPAVVLVAPDAETAWQLQLSDLQLVKLTPDEELKRALPRNIADALGALALRGPLDLAFRDLHMKGWNINDHAVTAVWKILPARLRGNSISAGMPITEITGNLAVDRGFWDGSRLLMDGFLELESARAIDMTYRDVRGPFLLQDNRLTFGTPSRNRPPPVQQPGNPYSQKQLTGTLYGGRVGLNIDVDLSQGAQNVVYDLDVTASDLLLAQWATDWRFSSQRLQGKINGEVRASGRGTSPLNTVGEGWVQVAPAALYDLPVFYQILTQPMFRPAQPSDAAFNYAYADFRIQQGEFVFPRIELIGDSFGLGGVGRAGYAGPNQHLVDLNLYSKNVRRVGFLKPLVDVLSNDWINVRINGSLAPGGEVKANVQPNIPLPVDPFPGFQQAIQPGLQAPRRN